MIRQWKTCVSRVATRIWVLLAIFGSQYAAAQSSPNYGVGLPATDALGRKLPDVSEVGGPRKDRFVGLFYWTWHTHQGRDHEPFNVTEILTRHPQAIDDFGDPAWPVSAGSFFWDEPLFGYYLDTDSWVLRKHAEMLADAGVDVLIFDCTNGHYTWESSYMALCRVFEQARRDGVNVPQIAFFLAFGPTDGSREAIEEIYQKLYAPGLYSDLWFRWKGKPLILAYPEMLGDVPGDSMATRLHHEIRNFFTFRPGQPFYDKGPARHDQWGWLQIFPQHGFGIQPDGRVEEVPVGVAQNWSAARGLTAMNAPGVFGRSYTHAQGHRQVLGAVNHGYNFQEQWDRAIALDPEFIFITGWNEWIAGRYKLWQQQPNAFPDEFSQEYSRDIEPMKGGHADNYYYQMVSNIRRFKGTLPEMPASEPRTIQVDGTFTDWATVRPMYTAHRGNTVHRHSPGWKGRFYIDTTGRNDIVAAKVARDQDYLYFYVASAQPLTSLHSRAWMSLFLDVDRDKQTGWQGYDFVINRRSPGSTALLEHSDGGWHWKAVGKVDYAVSGTGLELKVPRKWLGLTEKIDLEFKWSDNMQNDGDVMDFWLHGDAAPSGRFNYHYTAE